MENTQDIIAGYLSGGKYRADEDDFDLDSLADPLDDSMEMHRADSFPSPPTPHESPLKTHLDKLRGSPVKMSRSPLKAKLEDTFSDFDAADVIETHKYVTGVPEYISSSKEFDRYSRLLASSTDKLMRQLSFEQRKNHALEAKLAAYQDEKFSAQVVQGDYDVLKRELADLQDKYDALEGKSRLFEDTNLRLERENLLLREKLIKYRKLYEDLRAGSFRTHGSNERPRSSLEAVHTQAPINSNMRSVSADARFPETKSHTRKSIFDTALERDRADEYVPPVSNINADADVNDVRHANEPIDMDVETALRHLLHAISQKGNKANDLRSESVPPRETASPRVTTAASSKSSATIASKSSSGQLLDEYNQVLSILAHNVEQIGLDLKQINSTLKATEHPTTLNSLHSRQRETHAEYSPAESRGEYNLSSVGSGMGTNHHTHSQECSSQQCPACVAALSRLLSRPVSHSTAKDEGHTQALMGQYMWNRTV